MLPPVMEKLLSGKEFRQYAGMIDLAARKGVTGNQDTAASCHCHHRHTAGELDREERLVYTLVVGRMLETFMPPCRWNIRRLKRSVPHASSESVHTVFQRGGSVSFRGNGLSRKTTTSVPVPPELFRERTAGNGMQSLYTEIAALYPLIRMRNWQTIWTRPVWEPIHAHEYHPYAAGA